jgi:PAS domain-containing protein
MNSPAGRKGQRVRNRLPYTRPAELSLLQMRDQLEVEVQARTAELTQANTENEMLLEGGPVGIALLGPDRIVRRCNRAYEEMLGFECGDLIGCVAPLPDTEKETWKIQEEQPSCRSTDSGLRSAALPQGRLGSFRHDHCDTSLR